MKAFHKTAVEIACAGTIMISCMGLAFPITLYNLELLRQYILLCLISRTIRCLYTLSRLPLFLSSLYIISLSWSFSFVICTISTRKLSIAKFLLFLLQSFHSCTIRMLS
ncbi:hypothetical protein X975_21278, partial [Stegodyphus mimosarum]